jgi:hypothetical protein
LTCAVAHRRPKGCTGRYGKICSAAGRADRIGAGTHYTDPAYDAGRFLALLHQQCLHHPALMPRVPEMFTTFRAAFLTVAPAVSARNVSFYYALSFARRIYNDLVYQRVSADWPRVVASYAHYAMSALQTDVWPDGERRSSTPRLARTSAAPAAS